MEWDRVATLAVVLDRLDPKDRPKFQKLWQMAHDELEQLQQGLDIRQGESEKWRDRSSQNTAQTPTSPKLPVHEVEDLL